MRKLNNQLIWKSQEVVAQVHQNVATAYTEFGLMVEGNAKQELRKSEFIRVNGRTRWVRGGGHGVRSGTLRRSIHLAQPGYNWQQDDVPLDKEGPERGGHKVEAVVTAGRVGLQIGSGLHYALVVHQGHGSFKGHHYLTRGLDKTKPELPTLLKKHRMQR